MLSKRTNVLLSEADYQMLKGLASRKKKTIGELIRHAIRIAYNEEESELRQRQRAFAAIQKLQQNIHTKGIDYKELVEYGRRR